MELASRVEERTRAPAGAAPVLLATLGVPFDPEAARIAVDSAVEAGQALIVANVVELPFLPTSVILGYDQIDDPELSASVRAPAELAHSLGVHVERLRVKSPRPVEALLELVSERNPSFLVFGPDPTRLRPRRYRKAARAVRERAPCLVWVAD
jgi:hypothetical protein